MYAPTPRQINRMLLLPALFAVVALGVGRFGTSGSRAVGQDAPGATVVVDAYPDLAGEGAHWPDCPGCDGAFRAGDALLAEEQPLPTIEFSLESADGTVQTLASRAMSEGRQQVVFELDGPELVTIRIAGTPNGWNLCPEMDDEFELGASDFEDGQARFSVGFGPTCRPPGEALAADVAASTAPQQGESSGSEEPTQEPLGESNDDTASKTAADSSIAQEDESLLVEGDALSELAAAAINHDFSGAATDQAVSASSASDDADASMAADEVDATTDGSAAATSSAATRDARPRLDSTDGEPGGSVQGTLFEDANGNAQHDAGELGLSGVVVHVAGETGAHSTTTDDNGDYSVHGLLGLAFDVQIDVPAGLDALGPGRYARLAVADRDLRGVDFALVGAGSPFARDPFLEHSAADMRMMDLPMGGLPSTGLANLGARPVLLSIALAAGLLGLIGGVSERGRRRRREGHVLR